MAISALDINPNESIYVGDTIADYKATKGAGMTFALAKWHAFDTSEINADFELNSPA